MKAYNAANWYWIVGGDQTRAFSSQIGDYVVSGDATFQSWKADGTLPTLIENETNLGSVLSVYQLRPTNAGVLAGYTNALADAVQANVIFRILFNHENRIRTGAGQATITAAQFRTAIQALM